MFTSQQKIGNFCFAQPIYSDFSINSWRIAMLSNTQSEISWGLKKRRRRRIMLGASVKVTLSLS
jgi:hypothetical protein